MLKIHLVLRIIFLGLLVKFGNVSCASTGAAAGDGGVGSSRTASRSGSIVTATGLDMQALFDREHQRLLGDEAAANICRGLFELSGSPVSIETILVALSGIAGGNDARLDLKKSEAHNAVIDAVTFEAVRLLRSFKNPNSPDSMWVVGRLVSLLLLDSHTQTSHSWLSRVESIEEGASAKTSALRYLIGIDSPGIVTAALRSIIAREDLRKYDTPADQGTSMFGLSRIFYEGALNFPMVLFDAVNFASSQRHTLESRRTKEAREALVGYGLLEATDVSERPTIRIFAGMRKPFFVIDVLNEALMVRHGEGVGVPLYVTRLMQENATLNQERGALGARLETAIAQKNALRRFIDGISCWARCCCCMPTLVDDETSPLLGINA